ncbi:MAG: hypothetical protein L6Q80_14230 [Dehalococcoidia bacterium]|nr:hypothetical protein [Dehalococcoidia bacterium]
MFTSRRTRCSDCESQVLELALCQHCGSDYLVGRLATGEDGFELLRPVAFDEITQPGDESADPEPGDDGEAEGTDEDENEDGLSRADIRLVSKRRAQELASALLTPEIAIDPATGAVEEGEARYSLVAPERGETFECPHCGQRDRSHEELFLRSCRTGRNFVLGVGVPVLLEHMREEGGTNDQPFGGRRTISFTDSRQGTARFAAKAQGEAERNYVRSFVYHHVLAAQATAPAAADALRTELAKLKAVQSALPDPSILEGTILEKSKKLADAERGTRVPLQDVANALSEAWNFGHLLRYWRDYLPFREAGIKPEQLAKWMVLREFARRPMRRASLETLGLISVRFPNLDLTRDPPHLWQRWAGPQANETWHSFLKLLLDFYVRSNSAVLLDRQFFRWVGTTILPKVVGGPGEKPVRNRRISWPEIGGRSRLAWLLVRVFKLNDKDAQTRADIDSVLADAWDFVKPALQAAEGGRQLVMDKMELELVKNAWVCPLTRMLLDTTILGHTPYQPPLDQPFDSLARPVRMPVAPEAFGNNLARWFESDPVVGEARAAGAISEFTERVLTVSPYYQVAEHSAQLPGSTLQKTEEQFKKGYLNLLSCSTTMEMGVDIGGLTGVAMNNAPPSPANFLQRVGRAGRRGESAAVSLTVCRHLPHDQAVFDQPVWPFRTPMHITAVRLDSERIVERHVRAAALSRYLLTQAQPETILRLECAWFFIAPEGQKVSVCERLLAWFDSGARSDAELTTHLERITRATALDGIPAEGLLAGAAPAFKAAADAFDAVRRSLQEQREALPLEEREDSPAAYAIRRQLARLEGEYLLSYLADQQVLPGYGFPTGVVPFVTTTVEELKAIKMADDRSKAKRTGGTRETREDRQERIDARTKLMGFPSRDLPMALREYAPGNKVVLERRTYTPRGVTLNWHLPPEAGETSVRDVQALRTAWCCPMCGMSGTTAADLPRACPACAHTSLRNRGYLQPAGFAVDLYEDAEMDASPAVYIPVEEPWISSGTDRFETLGTPTLIRARHTPNGEIVHLSDGAHGHGYAVCLRCGRSEPEVEAKPDVGEVEQPTAMKDHKRLRGGKGSKWKEEKASATCEGNETSWAIRRHLAFGGSQRTDVLELQFLNQATGHLVADRVLLTTIAVALRKEAARAIGIDNRELGYQVAPRIVDGQSGFAVLLYDTASGGAGF